VDAHEEFFVDANLEGDPVEVLSPSGAYRLTIRQYRTKPRCWNYSRGVVTRVEDGAHVADIKRNYHAFLHTFVVKDGREYLITGRSYMSQTIVDLAAATVHDAPEAGFCWEKCDLSPDGRTLLVDGCIWACPAELRFFDFSDPARGWPELTLDGIEQLDERVREPAAQWLDAATIECHLREGEERVVLRRDGDVMRVVEHWISEKEQRRREDEARAEAELDAWWEEVRANDPMYRRVVELTRELGLVRTDGIHGRGRVTFYFRREGERSYVELAWDLDTAVLRLAPDGMVFPCSIAGIEDAVRAIAARLG
jgi:hypothetical protein